MYSPSGVKQRPLIVRLAGTAEKFFGLVFLVLWAVWLLVVDDCYRPCQTGHRQRGLTIFIVTSGHFCGPRRGRFLWHQPMTGASARQARSSQQPMSTNRGKSIRVRNDQRTYLDRAPVSQHRERGDPLELSVPVRPRTRHRGDGRWRWNIRRHPIQVHRGRRSTRLNPPPLPVAVSRSSLVTLLPNLAM